MVGYVGRVITRTTFQETGKQDEVVFRELDVHGRDTKLGDVDIRKEDREDQRRNGKETTPEK